MKKKKVDTDLPKTHKRGISPAVEAKFEKELAKAKAKERAEWGRTEWGQTLDEGVTPPVKVNESLPDHGTPKLKLCKRSDCAHRIDMHYGSPDKWCNTSGCGCMAVVE